MNIKTVKNNASNNELYYIQVIVTDSYAFCVRFNIFDIQVNTLPCF